MRVDLHARSAATASRHAARCPWLGAHWIFAPSNRETRLNAAQPGAKKFLRDDRRLRTERSPNAATMVVPDDRPRRSTGSVEQRSRRQLSSLSISSA
jgi:hypothetical protein